LTNIVNLLLSRGADLFAENSDGQTPADVAGGKGIKPKLSQGWKFSVKFPKIKKIKKIAMFEKQKRKSEENSRENSGEIFQTMNLLEAEISPKKIKVNKKKIRKFFSFYRNR
jgi:hypothetical protein